MSRINNIGVIAELVGAPLLLILLLAFHIKRGPGRGAADRRHRRRPHLGLLRRVPHRRRSMSAYVMYGFDTAGSLAEETNNPRKHAPRAILRALAAVVRHRRPAHARRA